MIAGRPTGGLAAHRIHHSRRGPGIPYNTHLALSFNRAIQAIENLGATGDKKQSGFHESFSGIVSSADSQGDISLVGF
jgi:hypothetical protein